MKAIIPPLLYRHPPPYSGKDDDPAKLREVADDVLTKMGYHEGSSCSKILFGPDNKIGKNLLNLIHSKDKYDTFLAEFPCLHLRKSRITTIFTANKNTGLFQLLQYMRDDNGNDWAKLISATHIDAATRNVRRLSTSLHLAFLTKFMQSLSDNKSKELQLDISTLPAEELCCKWDEEFINYINRGSKLNGTFALHKDMMMQLDSVLAIALAERLGGPTGYNLLLAAVKSTLPFSFVNGATSYAPYCSKLLLEHHRCGPFYKSLKQWLFSTPMKDGYVNLATDMKRELDHRYVTKCFRSGSTMSSVMRRMSLIDSLTEVHDLHPTKNRQKQKDDDLLGWEITKTDLTHIRPVVLKIMQRGGLSINTEDLPYNVYTESRHQLSSSMLDDNCGDVSTYLITKFLVHEKLCGLKSSDIPEISSLNGPKELIAKAKNSKGVTIKRSGRTSVAVPLTDRQQKEAKRKKILSSENKQVDALSSEMNACQALVKPDCS